jgi:hypothetical protein
LPQAFLHGGQRQHQVADLAARLVDPHRAVQIACGDAARDRRRFANAGNQAAADDHCQHHASEQGEAEQRSHSDPGARNGGRALFFQGLVVGHGHAHQTVDGLPVGIVRRAQQAQVFGQCDLIRGREMGQKTARQQAEELFCRAVRGIQELLADGRCQRLGQPEGVASLVFLLQIGQTSEQRPTLRRLLGVGELEGHQIRLDDVVGRRQDVGDQILAAHDVAVDRAIDFDLTPRRFQRGQLACSLVAARSLNRRAMSLN